MHYIRLLRPPHASPSYYDHDENDFVLRAGSTLSLVLAITTDLGDALLSPGRPIPLVAELVYDRDSGGYDPDDGSKNEFLPTGVTRSVIALPLTPSQSDGRGSGHKGDKGDKSGKNSKNGKNGKSAKTRAKDDRSGGSGRPDAVAWHAGMRVLKVDVQLDETAAFLFLCHHEPAYRRRLRIAPVDRTLAVEHAHQFSDNDAADAVRIVPLWVDTPPVGPPVPGGTGCRTRVTFPPLALRRLATGPGQRHYVEVEEDLGESIARHVWDAGLAAVAFVAEACRPGARQRRDAVADALRAAVLLPSPAEEEEDSARGAPTVPLAPLRVLELGSGVGILGIGLAEVVPRLTGRHAAVLLTDLPDAEERLLANIARVAEAKRAAAGLEPDGAADPDAAGGSSTSTSTLAYENLDWEDGRRGCFGRAAAVAPPKPGGRRNPRRPWDLVVLSDCTYNADGLPALVETLAALHAAARRVDPAFVSHALLFRKPRHADEEALFGLLAQHGWAAAARSTVPLPGGGDGPGGVMEVYLYRCP